MNPIHTPGKISSGSMGLHTTYTDNSKHNSSSTSTSPLNS